MSESIEGYIYPPCPNCGKTDEPHLYHINNEWICRYCAEKKYDKKFDPLDCAYVYMEFYKDKDGNNNTQIPRDKEKEHCQECNGKGYILVEREGEHLLEVYPCPRCMGNGTEDRIISAKAKANGIECDETYPCIVHHPCKHKWLDKCKDCKCKSTNWWEATAIALNESIRCDLLKAHMTVSTHRLIQKEYKRGEPIREKRNDKQYLVCMRWIDGLLAIERNDELAPENYSDEDAALEAEQDGIECKKEYPCFIKHPCKMNAFTMCQKCKCRDQKLEQATKTAQLNNIQCVTLVAHQKFNP